MKVHGDAGASSNLASTVLSMMLQRDQALGAEEAGRGVTTVWSERFRRLYPRGSRKVTEKPREVGELELAGLEEPGEEIAVA